MDDLHALPKIRDSFSYLYVEHAKIEQHEKSIAIWSADGGYSPVPAAALCVLMLGPGTTVSHAAVHALAENNCLMVWCGEDGVRCYAAGTGGTRSARPLILQASLLSNETTRMEVVKRMYRMRFSEWPADAETLTIEQLRGMEGARMRAAYAEASKRYGVVWDGRVYNRKDWNASDPINRALSAANSCLYGLCHAALLATGYSTGLGFIHTGKQLSFVYDVADLYKAEISIPVAFQVAHDIERGDVEAARNVERAARLRCRDRFRETKLLSRIVPDLQKIFGGKDLPSDLGGSGGNEDSSEPGMTGSDFDWDKALPGALWAPESEGGSVAGGVAYAPAEPSMPPKITEPLSRDDLKAAFAALKAESAETKPEIKAAPASPVVGSIEDLFFNPDAGCESPPWGGGDPPWEIRARKRIAAEQEKAEQEKAEQKKRES